MVHRESSGYLLPLHQTTATALGKRAEDTHDTMQSVILGFIFISFPLSSRGGVMVNTCSNAEMLMKSAMSAKCLPGQMLVSA